MNRILGIVCLFLLFASVKTYGQEVHGVETKLTKYSGPEYGSKNLWFGYSFTNMNSIPVSIDAELYEITRTREDGKIVSTKSFTLKSGETYIWKFENNSDFTVYDVHYNYNGRKYYSEKKEPKYTNNVYSGYFIKYKAYKLL